MLNTPSMSAPVYSATESRSATLDSRKTPPGNPARPSTTAAAPRNTPSEGTSQLARNRAHSTSAPVFSHADADENGVTYKPMRAYETGGKLPVANPEDQSSATRAPPPAQTRGTAPVLMDDAAAANENVPATGADVPAEDAQLTQDALMAEQQLLQQQYLTAMARTRFMNEVRIQQLWMQQQQAAVQQQQYNENYRRWLEGSQPAGSQMSRPQNHKAPTQASEEDGNDTASNANYDSVRGSYMSILAPASKQSQEPDEDDANSTASLATSRSGLYGDLSAYVVDDADDDTEAPVTAVSRDIDLDAEDTAATDMRDASGSEDDDGDDDDDRAHLAKQSSLFDIANVESHDRHVAASVPEPRRATTSRTLSLGVVIEPESSSVLKVTNKQTVVITDPQSKMVCDFELDEATSYSPKDTDTVSSELLRELSRHTLEGHRAVLLTSVSDGAEQGGEALIRTALCNLVSGTGADENASSAASALLRVDASAVVIRRGEVMDNLLAGLANATSAHSLAMYSFGGSMRDSTYRQDDEMDSTDSSFAPVVSAANPVAGHWFANTTFVPLRTARDVEATVMSQVQPWLQKSAAQAQAASENLALFATVVQQKAESQPLYLSSLLILVSRSPDEAYRACTRPQKLPPPMEKLLKRVGHGVFTVAACCLSSDAGGATRDYATACRSLQAVHNSSMLSGNVQRYLSYAKRQHSKASARLDELRTSHEAPETVAFAQQALQIHAAAIVDMEELINDPKNAPVRFMSDATAAPPEATRDSAPSAARSVSAAAAATTPVAMSAAAERDARASSPQSVQPADQWRELGDDAVSKASRKASTPADQWKELGDDAVSKASHKASTPAAKARELSPSALTATSAAAPVAPAPTSSVSFADRRVHVVAIVDSTTSGYTIGEPTSRTDASGATTTMTIVQSDPKRVYTVDEAVSAQTVASAGSGAPFSEHVTALCQSFASGHNAALISYDGRNNNLFESPAWSAVREAVRCALDCPTDTRDLRFSVTLLNGTGEAADLLVSASDYRPITIVASPLFGAVVDGARLVPIYSENDVRELLFTVAANIGSRWPGDTCLHVTLVSSVSTHADVMVASFNASIFGSHHRFCSQVLAESCTKPITALHRLFTQGTAASVLLAGFTNEHDAIHARNMMEDVGKLPEKQPVRDGSVRVFVRETRKSLERRTNNAAQLTSDDERRRADKVNRKIESMVTDYEETLYEPATHFPKSYTNSSDSAVTGIAAGARAVPAQEKQQQKLHPYLVIGLEQHGSVAAKLRVNGHGVTWSATGENFDSDDTVVQYRRADSAAIASAFTATGELERLASCAKTGKSAAILGITDVGGNGAGVVRPVQLQSWWLAYRQALTSAVFLDKWESGSTVELRAVVLQDKLIVHDFLLTPPSTTDVATPVKIAVSPIVGSVVANATVKEVKSAQATTELVSLLESRMNAYKSQRDNTVVVVHALLRRVSKNVSVESTPITTGLVSTTTTHDVVLSSLSATAVRVNNDLPALREILALDPQGTVPYSLFRFPLTGTSRTVCVIDLDSCSEARATEALRLAQRIRYCNTLPVPSGSVHNYVAYETNRLNSNKSTSPSADSVSATSPATMLATMKTFLHGHGKGEIPLFAVQDARTAAGADITPKSRGIGSSRADGSANVTAVSPKRQASKTVVVVTNREVVSTTAGSEAKRGASTPVQADVQAHTVTLNGQRYTYAEVAARADNASVARPDLIRSAANNAIHGYNVALLMVDGTGSTCVSALLSRAINLILSNKTERKLYLSMVALKHRSGAPDEVKDMLRVGDYTALEVATSPLFGSCINGARFSQIKNPGDIFVTLRDALSVCAVEKSVLVVTLVMRQKDVLYSDVTVNSLTAVLCNSDNAPAGSFAGGFLEDTLMEPDVANRGLLRTCCGAQPYYTYGVIGISGLTPPAEAKRLLELGERISKVMCRFPRPSSARKLADYAKKKQSQTPTHAAEPSTPTAGGGEFIDEPNWDWERIREDTEKMLQDELCKPKAYVLE